MGTIWIDWYLRIAVERVVETENGGKPHCIFDCCCLCDCRPIDLNMGLISRESIQYRVEARVGTPSLQLGSGAIKHAYDLELRAAVDANCTSRALVTAEDQGKPHHNSASYLARFKHAPSTPSEDTQQKAEALDNMPTPHESESTSPP